MQPFFLCSLCATLVPRQLALYDGSMPHRIYFWRVQDRNGRWYKTRFRTTEEHIRKEHPEAVRIDSDAMDVQRVDRYKPMHPLVRSGDE